MVVSVHDEAGLRHLAEEPIEDIGEARIAIQLFAKVLVALTNEDDENEDESPW